MVEWQTKALGEVLLKTKTVNPTQSPDEEFDYIDVSSVSNETFSIEVTQRLKGKEAPSRARRHVRSGDVLFATIRPTLKRIAIVPEELDGQVCSTGYFVLRPCREIDHRFLFYALFSEQFMGSMECLQKGASYPAVTDAEVRAQSISFPSLLEQRRIVAILDEAFEAIATAKANAEKNMQNARNLFDSCVRAVLDDVQGGYEESTLEQHCVIGDGNHSANYPTKDELVEDGVPFIRATNLVAGRISGSDMRFLSPQKHEQLKKGHLKTGDILITNRGEIGRTALVDECYDGANLNSQIAWLRCRKLMHNKFLFHVLNSEKIRFHFQSAKSGTALQQFTIKQLKALRIPAPPIDVQQSVSARLDDFSEGVQSLSAIYLRKLSALDELKKSLLHQAFTGQL